MKKILFAFIVLLLVLPFVARADEPNRQILPQGVVPGVESPVILDNRNNPANDQTKKTVVIREQEKKQKTANPQNLQIFFPGESNKIVVK